MRYFQFFPVVCRASRCFISPFLITGCNSFPLSSLFNHSSFIKLWKVQYYLFIGLGITRHEPKAKIFLNLFSVSCVLVRTLPSIRKALFKFIGRTNENIPNCHIQSKGSSHTNVSMDKNRRKTSKILHAAYVISGKVIKMALLKLIQRQHLKHFQQHI